MASWNLDLVGAHHLGLNELLSNIQHSRNINHNNNDSVLKSYVYLNLHSDFFVAKNYTRKSIQENVNLN